MAPSMGTLRVLLSVRMLFMLLFGFSSGLPLLLTGSTLQAWLMDEGVPLQTIGLFALVGLPYALKFLWSPVLDYVVPPFLGRRRGWILGLQIALALVLAALGLLHPARIAWLVAVIALVVTFVSASQDIVLDAYRRELLVDEELGRGGNVTPIAQATPRSSSTTFRRTAGGRGRVCWPKAGAADTMRRF